MAIFYWISQHKPKKMDLLIFHIYLGVLILFLKFSVKYFLVRPRSRVYFLSDFTFILVVQTFTPPPPKARIIIKQE